MSSPTDPWEPPRAQFSQDANVTDRKQKPRQILRPSHGWPPTRVTKGGPSVTSGLSIISGFTLPSLGTCHSISVLSHGSPTPGQVRVQLPVLAGTLFSLSSSLAD